MLIRQSLKDRTLVLSGEEPWGIVLSDFGLSCLNRWFDIRSNSCLQETEGTLDYLPVEQFYGKTTIKSDIYALAKVILWTVNGYGKEIITLNDYFDNQKNARELLANNETIFSTSMQSLLLKMLSEKQNERSTIDDFISEMEQIGQQDKSKIFK